MWLAQTDSLYSYSYNVDVSDGTGWAVFAGAMLFVWLVVMVLAIVGIVAMWKMFKKAGQPGWAAIIPIYNQYTMLKVAGRPGWWLIWYFIPIAQIVVSLIVAMDIAKAFGRSEAFGVVALWLFSIIGYLILGFGKDAYKGPQVAA
jgi:hypothetical protein